MEEILKVFIHEAREMVSAMETGLMRMESGVLDPEVINAVFRAAHTIKGSAGVVDLDLIVAFAHVVENTLDKLRNNEITVGGELVSVLLNCCDHIGALVEAVAAGNTAPDADLQQLAEPLLTQLRSYLAAPKAQAGLSSMLAEPEVDPIARINDGGVSADHWHISVRFGPDVLKMGMDPLSFIRYLDMKMEPRAGA